MALFQRHEDMEMPTSDTLPWLDSPVTLHGTREFECDTLTEAQCDYYRQPWHFWYVADWTFAHATVYFLCAMIGVFIIANVISKLRGRSKSHSQNSLLHRALATCRLLSYRTYYIRALDWYSPPLGVILLGLTGVVYFFGLTLGPKPYYWPTEGREESIYGGSPPLATRSGWMSLAMLPFVVMFASKANWITLVTGVSHEKLQVFHRWVSWAMFILALLHAFPFIVLHIWLGDMTMQWKASLFYWTGVAALVPQGWLNMMSIGPIRNRYYEFFKYTHYLAICFFVFFLFIHCDFILTSWDYFIAAGSLYFATLIFQMLRTAINSINAEAKFLILADSTIKVTIPSKMKWHPGQHVFLRFWALGLHAMTMHPFTLCSAPSSGEMVFYIKPARGFTSKLKKLVENNHGTMAMSIDGPYGHATLARDLAANEKVVLLAGGSGAGFLLPIIESLVKDGRPEVRVVIAVRRVESTTWIVEAIEKILGAQAERANVKVEIYVTDGESLLPKAQTSTSLSETDIEKTGFRSPSTTSQTTSQTERAVTIVQGRGRPDMIQVITSTANVALGEGVGVTACGPASMMLDIRTACAEAQGRILKGTGGARELYLHTETFSW